MLVSTIATIFAASVALAATPDGFQPASTANLMVTFNNRAVDASGGKAVRKAETAQAPTIMSTTPLTGTSYAVIMVDIDIPGGGTLLHWLQTGMTVAPAGGAGGANTPPMSMVMQGTAAAEYLGPNPPAQEPLTHRYVQLLVDTTGVANADAALGQAAAAGRRGFNTQQVLSGAGLTAEKIVGGNFFTVTNGK